MCMYGIEHQTSANYSLKTPVEDHLTKSNVDDELAEAMLTNTLGRIRKGKINA